MNPYSRVLRGSCDVATRPILLEYLRSVPNLEHFPQGLLPLVCTFLGHYDALVVMGKRSCDLSLVALHDGICSYVTSLAGLVTSNRPPAVLPNGDLVFIERSEDREGVGSAVSRFSLSTRTMSHEPRTEQHYKGLPLVVTVGNSVYVMCELQRGNPRAEMFDDVAKKWQTVPPCPSPSWSPRGGVCGSDIFMWHDDEPAGHRYDTRTRQWTKDVAPFQFRSTRLACMSLGSTIVVLLQQAAGFSLVLYCPVKKEWRFLSCALPRGDCLEIRSTAHGFFVCEIQANPKMAAVDIWAIPIPLLLYSTNSDVSWSRWATFDHFVTLC